MPTDELIFIGNCAHATVSCEPELVPTIALREPGVCKLGLYAASTHLCICIRGMA